MIGACVIDSCSWLATRGWLTAVFSRSSCRGVWLETPNGPHLAGGVQLVERPRDLVGLDERVGAVQQQHVDPVGAQRPQRPLDLARRCS